MIDDSYLVAAALLTRKAFEDLTAAGMEASSLPAQQAALWDEIGRLYSADTELQAIPRALLDPVVEARFPNPKHARQVIEYLDGLPQRVTEDSVTDTYRRLKAYRVGLTLADALVKADADEALPLARRYVELHDGRKGVAGKSNGHDWNPRLSVEDIFEQEKAGAKIRAYPKRLNEILRGGLRPGHNVLVFGRPESGKTLVTVNCVAGMAAAGNRILYVCNEESHDAIQRRFLSRLGQTRLWDLDDSDVAVARAHYEAAVERAGARGWANVHILHDASVRLADVPRYIERVEPTVMVLDQIRNVGAGGKDDNLVRSLEVASRALREWGSEYGMVTIGVTQAAGSAEGRGHLSMTDIADSKTGAPGAYDLIMGAGVTQEMKVTGKRIINIVKNKVSGTETSFPIWIDPQYTAVRDAPVKKEQQ